MPLLTIITNEGPYIGRGSRERDKKSAMSRGSKMLGLSQTGKQRTLAGCDVKLMSSGDVENIYRYQV